MFFNYIRFFRTVKWKKKLQETETFLDGGEIPCILVENKIDLLDDPKEGEESLKELSENSEFCGCFRTSAKTGKNISESMEFLIKTIIKRIKDMEEKNIPNEHKRDTITLNPQNSIRKEKRNHRCC